MANPSPPLGSNGTIVALAPTERLGQETETSSGLSASDLRHLEKYETKLQMLRDRTGAVANGYATGLFLHGPGGVSKSYTVLQELERLQANYRVSNSRMTGRGLIDFLEMFPDCIHVIEDAEAMMRDKNAVGVLRSALWGQRRDGDKGPQERWVTWSAYKTHKEILFTGGVIVISNRPLLDMPELQALKTRIPCLLLQPSDNEIRAMMRHLATKGYEHEGRVMDPEECREVCEYIIGESLSLHRPLDMRLLINSFRDYLQWQEGDAGVHWQDMTAALVRERPTWFKNEVDLGKRTTRKLNEQQIAKDISEATSDREERLTLWKERTGKSKSAFYRRLDELNEG